MNVKYNISIYVSPYMRIHNVGFFACTPGKLGGRSFRTSLMGRRGSELQNLERGGAVIIFFLGRISIFDGEFLGFGVMTLPDSWHSCLPFADPLNKICRSKPNSYWLNSYCLLVHPLVHEFRWSNPSSGGYQWLVIPRLSMIAGSPRRRTRRIWENRARPKPGWWARERLPKWPNFSRDVHLYVNN